MELDHDRARAVMESLGARLGEDALLWRGAETTGSDVDLVVFPEGAARLADTLRAEGLERRNGDGLWRSPDGTVAIDPLPASDWPAWYPPLEGVRARASRPEGLPPVAAPPDRLLIFAADAVSGRPVYKLVAKARGLADEEVRRELRALGDALGDRSLAELIAEPEALLAAARRGRLPYGRAVGVATGSRSARRALGHRIRNAAKARLRPPRRRARGVLIGLSGMDGAGKSSAALAIERRLAAAGRDPMLQWHRLGEDSARLNRLAVPLKRLLRRSTTIADPLASRSPTETEKRQDPRVAAGRHGPVSWTWILLVTALTVHAHRQTRRLVRSGRDVVCDRWVCDSIVDLQVRYGAHRAARWLLERAAPRGDLAILLWLDAETAAARKPEDQALSVLRRMEALYDDAARAIGADRVDASRPLDAVLADVTARVDAAIRGRG